ncbi:hypothetical protein H5397_05035 [Propioniciclava sp. MC1683]|uniref:hypothetical protein n=1 Tax=Propioniciclava sp. MC1683 TaxID=2760309 RepID=UPI001603C712|nr:hypothetical protein [Propioniciclava sp. MC1683]MBB1500802.1 hypothetical protein [Propioniciclava sp. MC1683]
MKEAIEKVMVDSDGAASDASKTAIPSADFTRGARLLLLLTQPNAWIHRRVESVAYTVDGLVRRSVSLDFSPMAPQSEIEPLPSTANVEDSIIVPLAVLKKEPLALLDVRDENNAALPILGTEENGFLSYSALLVLAHGILGISTEDGIPFEIRELLYHIALDPAPAAEAVLDHIRRSKTPALVALSDDAVFVKLAADLAANFVLLAEMQFKKSCGSQRRIAKFSYVTTPARLYRRRISTWLFAPNERTISFDLPSIGDAQSYHFQFSPPSTVVVAECSLEVRDPFEGVGVRAGNVVGGTGHLQANVSSPGTAAVGSITVSPAQHGPIVSALVSSALNALIVCAFAAWAVAASRSCMPDDGDQVSAWQALFIALPALAAGFLAHQGELGLLSSMLSGARATLLASSITTLVVALALAVGLTGEPLIWVLVASSIVSVACCTRLTQWYVRCRVITNRR